MNILDLIQPHIKSLNPYSSAREDYQGDANIYLDANENPFGKLNRYPDPYQGKIKQLLQDIKGISANHIFIGNGSDELIDLIFRVFTQPKRDKVLAFTPTYGMYKVSADIHNVEMVTVPLNDSFQPDLDEFSRAISDSSIKVVFICSPNNPTGNCIDMFRIEYILREFKGIVLLDEAYIDFIAHRTCIGLLRQYPNLVISQTLSKAWALAGARIGIAYAHSKVIQTLDKVKPPYNVSELNQQAAVQVLQNSQETAENIVLIIKERKRLAQRLEQLKIVKHVFDSDANFLLVEFSDAHRVYKELKKHQIIVRNRSGQVQQTLRISIGTPEDNNLLFNVLKNLR